MQRVYLRALTCSCTVPLETEAAEADAGNQTATKSTRAQRGLARENRKANHEERKKKVEDK